MIVGTGTRGWIGLGSLALGLWVGGCSGDDAACESAGCTEATATATEGGAGTEGTAGTAGGSESESAGESATTSAGSVSASDGTTSDGTTAATEGTTTAVTSESESESGITETTESTTGPTCEDECGDGVCIGDGICCPVDDACGDECCAGDQVCSFGSCVEPGATCVSASDCPADSYCDYGLGEANDQLCGNGTSLGTGLCLPQPALCPPGDPPEDPNDLECLPTCVFTNDGDFEPAMKYAWTAGRVMMPPIVTQLDDDNCDGEVDDRDIPDILWSSFAGGAYNTNGTLHAYSIINGEMVEKWAINPQSNRIWPGKALAAGDLDGVPGAEIVACTEGGRVRAFRSDGSAYWESLSVPYCDMPAIVDFDGDGEPEVLLAGSVLSGQTGAVKASFPVKNPASWWRERAIAADLDGDGVLEIVTATRAFKADGTMIADSKLTGTFPAIADLDGDGEPEVIVVANLGSGSNVHHIHVWRYDPEAPDNARVVRQNVDINGPLNPNLCPVNSNGRTGGGGPPTVAEFNGDGKPDVGVAGGVGYAVFDGAKLVDENIPNASTLIWARQTQDCSSSFTGSSVYDFDGDGRAEVVYGDERYLRIYRGFDGEILTEICNTSGTLHEYPLIADVDGDGHADIVAASNNYSSFVCAGNVKTTGVRIFSNPRWTRTRKTWNQHAYYVTNINDDATVPTQVVDNWKVPGLNNFRQNYIEGIFDAGDLVITGVKAECDGDYGLTARVRNIGRVSLAHGVRVDFYLGDPEMGGILLGSGETTKALDPAEAEEVALALPDPPAALIDGSEPAFAVVNPEGQVLECRPKNNTTQGSGLCE